MMIKQMALDFQKPFLFYQISVHGLKAKKYTVFLWYW